MWTSVESRRLVWSIVLFATATACTSGRSIEPESTDRPNATPVVSNGTSTVEATLVICGPSCDGPGMLGEPPNILVADGHSEVVVRVASPYTVSATWAPGEFQRRDNQTIVAPPPPPGCHTTSLTVTGVDDYDWEFTIVILGDSDSDCGERS